MGPDQPVVPDERADSGRPTSWPTGSPPGPTRSYAGTKRQLNAWQFARLARTSSNSRRRSRPISAARRTSWRASPRSSRSARRDSRDPDPTARRRPVRPYTAGPRARRTYSRSPAARARRGARRGPARRAGRARGAVLPGGRRLAERRQHQDALHHGLRARAVHLRGRRGHAAVVAVALPRPQGPHRRPDPRQHEARGRLDGRRRRDPDLHHGLHLHQARPPSRTRSRRWSTPTGPRWSTGPSTPRPTCTVPAGSLRSSSTASSTCGATATRAASGC